MAQYQLSKCSFKYINFLSLNTHMQRFFYYFQCQLCSSLFISILQRLWNVDCRNLGYHRSSEIACRTHFFLEYSYFMNSYDHFNNPFLILKSSSFIVLMMLNLRISLSPVIGTRETARLAWQLGLWLMVSYLTPAGKI